MSDAMNPTNQNTRREATSTQMARATEVMAQRPGLVTFAAVMMFLLAGFQVTWAIVEIANAHWISNTTYGTFGGYLWLWAIFDLLLAAAAFYGGYDLLRGGAFGFFYSLGIAGFSALRWFFYLPAAPWLGIVIIAVDILIIYGLVSNSEYFKERASY